MANANAHFDPKVLGFLHDTSSVTPHRDSGNARALEKSGAIGKLNVAMYICLRTAGRVHLAGAAVNQRNIAFLWRISRYVTLPVNPQRADLSLGYRLHLPHVRFARTCVRFQFRDPCCGRESH